MKPLPLPNNSLTAPKGFAAASAHVGIKQSKKPDLMLLVGEGPCRATAVFTTNQIPSEPVQVDREHLKRSASFRAIICNSGCANASTGSQGIANARTMCEAVAEQIGCKPHEVLVASTGIIGQQLPMDCITPGITKLAGELARGSEADLAAARAIMTTDLVPKAAVKRVTLAGKRVTIAGIAKGSGMIAPNMATMLGFLTTDADISAPLLRAALKQAVNADASFNRISVDTDTSPSDTVAILASGGAGNPPIKQANDDYQAFVTALTEVCRDLAYRVVHDGEGATHVIRVIVENAKSARDAERIARATVDSPLVKTAVHGGDPNWGRLTTAAGKCGAAIRPEKLSVFIGRHEVYRAGQPVGVGRKQRQLEQAMQRDEVVIRFDVGLGSARCEMLGCDLSREYITINADYHT
ncbi:MAG: bifunctional glutamate N-acetyltransferase/amino-acid acetyltransferase ArgJ [Phycisphaeraceae bacterium]